MKTKIILLLLIVFSLNSCNKWLDVDLIDRVNEDKLFSKPEGFTEALAGIYSQMSKKELYGSALTMEHMDAYAQYYTSTSHAEHIKYNYTNATVESFHQGIWTNMYSCISGANNIIRWLDKNGSILTESRQKQVRGEAIALRAFLHFDLIRMFCPDVKRNPKDKGIPYNKTFGVSLPAQYNVEECIQLVLNDLNEAETLLAGDPINDVRPYEMPLKNDADQYVARINLYAVKAMKARLYMMRGENKNAIKYAKEVIESKKFQLLDFADVDKDRKDADIIFSDEHIFSLRNKEIPEISDGLFKADETNPGATIPVKLSFKNTYVLYEANNNDLRYVKWFQSSVDNKVGFYKYNNENYSKFPSKIVIIKLSEMYLICAEAYFNDNIDTALEYINTLRDHRIRGNNHWQYLTKEYIFAELLREFSGEGQAFYAYKRLNKAIPTLSMEGDIQPSNDVFVFPIPKKEIETGNRQ